ncbi:hypothetical protein GKE82_22445 [Conexibacter sp. W3-3-2]|uniref:hypothetical protein n=1 Tax=Conexibacter sp. W3-3-2 TaxID=2675227 RepID=UPI0012B7478A|nr:hypothetical protein [Conexibacter sp. W3-3-2]MTD46970.1 hypothetical protein [Conexibacter sp. W3-3-2]
MLRLRAFLLIAVLAGLALVVPSGASAAKKGKAAQEEQAPTVQSDASAKAGGAEFGTVDPTSFPTVPGDVAVIDEDGIASAPENAPDAVKQIIWAANGIVGLPYRYGGGHGDFEDTAYDCSGTVSFALAGADLLRRPRDSRSFFTWGKAGRGKWVTVYTASDHAYMTVAGIRLDTSAADDRGGLKGPRWRPLRKSNRGFKARRPVGL